MAIEIRDSLRPVVDFCIQMIVGALLFVVILIVAVVIAGIVHALSLVGFSPPWLINAAHWIEWVIFWVDVLYYALFSLSELAKLARQFWREWQRG